MLQKWWGWADCAVANGSDRPELPRGRSAQEGRGAAEVVQLSADRSRQALISGMADVAWSYPRCMRGWAC